MPFFLLGKFFNIYSKKSTDVIPARDVGIQEFFEHESYAKFLLVSKGWIPVSSTGMTRKKALISYVSDKKDDVMPVPRHWHPVFS
ncbi:hypothetical protein [Wolbachia endosymbiont (group B) of Gerris lacustris]|uniref:hypothetical protein n=1 Tax=Wolbachia endosymbiont (group B) of Gerris lacustris TaxID=3066159 RepID=UPI0033423EA5